MSINKERTRLSSAEAEEYDFQCFGKGAFAASEKLTAELDKFRKTEGYNSKVTNYRSLKFLHIRGFMDSFILEKIIPDRKLVKLSFDLRRVQNGRLEVFKKGTILNCIRDFSEPVFCEEVETDNPRKVTLSTADFEIVSQRFLSQTDVLELSIKPSLPNAPRKGYNYVDRVPTADKGAACQGYYVISPMKMAMYDTFSAIKRYVKRLQNEASGLRDSEIFFWLGVMSVDSGLLREKYTAKGPKGVADYNELLRHNIKNESHKAMSCFDEVLVIFDSFCAPFILSRAWALWELYGLAKFKKPFRIIFPSTRKTTPGVIEYLLRMSLEDESQLSLYPHKTEIILDQQHALKPSKASLPNVSFMKYFDTLDFQVWQGEGLVEQQAFVEELRTGKGSRQKMNEIKIALGKTLMEAVLANLYEYVLKEDSRFSFSEIVKILRASAKLAIDCEEFTVASRLIEITRKRINEAEKKIGSEDISKQAMQILSSPRKARFGSRNKAPVQKNIQVHSKRDENFTLKKQTCCLMIDEAHSMFSQENIRATAKILKAVKSMLESLKLDAFLLALENALLTKQPLLSKNIETFLSQLNTTITLKPGIGEELLADIKSGEFDKSFRGCPDFDALKNQVLDLAKAFVGNHFTETAMLAEIMFLEARCSQKQEPDKFVSLFNDAIQYLDNDSRPISIYLMLYRRIELGKFLVSIGRTEEAFLEFQVALDIADRLSLSKMTHEGRVNSIKADLHFEIGKLAKQAGNTMFALLHLQAATKFAQFFTLGVYDFLVKVKVETAECKQLIGDSSYRKDIDFVSEAMAINLGEGEKKYYNIDLEI